MNTLDQPKRRGRPRKIPVNTIEEITTKSYIEEQLEDEYWVNPKTKEEPVENNTRPTCWASFEATINLGNYQNEKIAIGLAGIPINATSEEIEVLLEGGKATIEMVVEKLGQKMAEQIEALGGFRL